MRLLFVHQKLGEFGGAEANIRLSAKELCDRGYQLGLLHLESTGRNEEHWRKLFPQCFSPPQTGGSDFVHSLLKKFSPQVIYLHNVPNLEILETLLDSGVPVIRMVHDHELYCMRGYKYDYFTRRICTRPFSPFCVFPCLASIAKNPGAGFPLKWVSYRAKRKEIGLNKRCDHLVVYSEYLKNELLRNGFAAERIKVVVPIRVRSDPTLASSFNSRNLILFAGQLIRGKGVDVLLQALAKVKTHFECAILGDGSHRSYCERLSRKLGLEGRVHFKGYVLPTELGNFYHEASVFVMGSLWPEPFGMVGVEAGSLGVPSWSTVFPVASCAIPWKNTELFAARLDQLLRDKALARQLGRNGFEGVQRYDSCRQIDHLERIFQDAVSVKQVDRDCKFPSKAAAPL